MKNFLFNSLLLGLIGLGWHLFLVAVTISSVGSLPDVKLTINYLTDEMTITYMVNNYVETPETLLDKANITLDLERGINRAARNCFDFYVLINPYRVTVKVENQ
jgi:hypothetical protein